MKKKLLAILLVLSLVASFGVMSVSAFADDEAPTWDAVKGDVERVIIANGVVAIPADAFNGFTALTSVVLPASVLSVSANAFSGTKIAEVQTAADASVIEGVDGLADAEVTEISADDFAALEEEVRANGTAGFNFVYDASSKTMLVTAFNVPVFDAGSAAPAAAEEGSRYTWVWEDPIDVWGGRALLWIIHIYDEDGVEVGAISLFSDTEPTDNPGNAWVSDGTDTYNLLQEVDMAYTYTSDTERTGNGVCYIFDDDGNLVDTFNVGPVKQVLDEETGKWVNASNSPAKK